MSDISNAPAWFDAKHHRVAEGGIFETATGVLLGEDGEPASAAVRQLRAGAPAAPVKKPRATKPKPAPRGTEQVLADYINTGTAGPASAPVAAPTAAEKE